MPEPRSYSFPHSARSRANGSARSAENRKASGGAGHHRGHPVTSDPEYTGEEWAYMRAMRAFIERTGRRFPTLCDHLAVLKSLGYSRPGDDG